MRQSPEFFVHRLSTEPLLFIAKTSEAWPLGPIGSVAAKLPDRSAHVLASVSWSHENPVFLDRIVSAYKRHLDTFPKTRVTILCNTPREVTLLTERGMNASLCNHNIFVDEHTFTIDPGGEKEFDAIYVAVVRRFKRHQLCSEIPRVALVYYDLRTRADPGYFEELKASLPNAVFVNEVRASQGLARPVHPAAQALFDRVFRDQGHVNLPPAGVAALLNRSAVGLCLSKEEGAMKASIEYLLAGLPVVSTSNRGGRDCFFEPDYCSTVDADASIIAREVAGLSRRAPKAEVIRSRTLEKIWRERSRFLDFLRETYAAEGIAQTGDLAWENVFTTPFWQRWTVDELVNRPDEAKTGRTGLAPACSRQPH